MEILAKHYVVTMPNGEKWSLPVNVIAEHRAKHYAHEFDGDVEKSLKEDTAPLFEYDYYEIKDWARNNMNWSDVESSVTLISTNQVDYQDGWINGDAEVL